MLHGNTYDCLRASAPATSSRYGVLAEFLAEQVFGRWSLVLHYDLGQGLRAYVGRDEQQRLKDMVALANRKIGDLSALPKDPAAAFAVLDRFVRNNIMARGGRSPEPRRDHRSGVVRLSVRRARAGSTCRPRPSS